MVTFDNRSEIRIALENRPLPIPYNPSKREDGENFGYWSIVKNPKALDQIPELHGEVRMKEFFRCLNDVAGIFESVRMVHWFSSNNAQTQRVLSFGFVFRDRQLFAEYSNCLLFAGSLLHHLSQGSILCDIPFLIEIQPAIFREERVNGWIMDLYVSGVGDSENAARDRLDEILMHLLPFFRNGGMS